MVGRSCFGGASVLWQTKERQTINDGMMGGVSWLEDAGVLRYALARKPQQIHLGANVGRGRATSEEVPGDQRR